MKREPDPGQVPTLAAQPISIDVLREKYLKPGETTLDDLFRRVARALASVEAPPLRAEWERRFFANLEAGGDWALVHKAKPGAALIAQGAHARPDGMWAYRTVSARELWDTIMKSAYDFAEPGILFTDTINRDNNLRYAEMITATNPCVTADTWVLTTEGPQQVKDLIGRPFVAAVDGKGFATASDGFFPTGRKKVVELSTREGYSLKLTPDHKLRKVTRRTRYVMEVDWASAVDLQPGDEVLLHDHRAMEGWSGAGTREEGYLLGLLVGDGTLKSDKAVISVWSPELKQVGSAAPAYAATGAAGIIHAAESAAHTLRHRADFRGFQRPVAGGRGEARMASAPLRDLAASFGMAPGAKTITPQIEKSSSEFACAFLRGLFDADGSVQGTQAKGVSVRLTQSDRTLLQSAQRMLLRLGIASSLYSGRKPALVRAMPDGKGGSKLYAAKEVHELVISGDNLPVFMQRVGFCDTAKSAKLEEQLGTYARALNRERFTARIASIEMAGEEEVFDVTVTDVHAFDANGLYAHNCGEQPLPPYGCCDLGPVVLTRFVHHAFGFGGVPRFDFERFAHAVAVQVRALDNVLDITHWPLPQQRAEAMAKRRIGVGFTGLGDTLVMLGLRYDAAEGREMAARIARCMRDAAYAASVELAKEKGPFPVFDAEGYLEAGTFASRLDEPLKQAIRQHGIRNSHLLSIAPTGTVSLAFADNASNGIEPAFSWTYRRRKREGDGTTTEYSVEDHAWRAFRSAGGDVANLPASFVSALQMRAADHLSMMEAVQPFVDTAISKTVNVPAEYPYEDFKNLYMQAWQAQLKGLATYRPNDILGAVLDVPAAGASEPEGAQAARTAPADAMRTVIEKRPQGNLPAVVEKIDYWTQEGRKNLYIVVSFLPLPDGRERAIEFFMPVGQSGESQQWITSSMRLLSLAARGGFLERALADMRKVAWDRGPVRLGTYAKADGTQVPMWHDSEVSAIAFAIQNIIARRRGEPVAQLETPEAPASSTPQVIAGRKCPECGAHALIRKDGCDFCSNCGHLGACG
jgi:ribonucleoside-diphosphate reductase alpha chain